MQTSMLAEFVFSALYRGGKGTAIRLSAPSRRRWYIDIQCRLKTIQRKELPVNDRGFPSVSSETPDHCLASALVSPGLNLFHVLPQGHVPDPRRPSLLVTPRSVPQDVRFVMDSHRAARGMWVTKQGHFL